MTVDEYIIKFLPLAQRVEAIYKIPHLFSLAQSALETGWAKSTPGNMMFGIKAGSTWKGKTQKLLTTEIVTKEQLAKYKDIHTIRQLPSGKYEIKVYQVFRAYDSQAQSFDDYGKLLNSLTRYKAAFSYIDPYKFGYEVAKAGYATAQNYYGTIKSIMDTIKKKLTDKNQ